MKEVALFCEDLLAGTEDDSGKYRFFIGYSPEHGFSANTTFDIGVARAMLTSGAEQTVTLRLPPSCRLESAKATSGGARLGPVAGKPDYRTVSLPARKRCRVEIVFRK
jgi:hypothetical protein